jgi:hypothetical protein
MDENEGYVYQMKVKGVSHAAVIHHASSVTFLPTDFPEAFTRPRRDIM